MFSKCLLRRKPSLGAPQGMRPINFHLGVFQTTVKENCSRIFTAREQLVPLKGCATINFKALSPLEFERKKVPLLLKRNASPH